MEIQPLSLRDKHAWAELLAICFQRSCTETQNLLDWLYQLHTPIAWGAWEGDKLVAQYTALFRPLSLGEGTMMVGMSVNMAVHPDYRGRGYIKHIAAPVYNAIRDCGGQFGVGFSNAEGVKVDKRSQSYGYQVIGQLSPIVGITRRQNTSDLQLSTHFPLDCMQDDIQSTSLCFPKSPNYLCQRYAYHPFRQYHFASNEEGVVVYRPFRRGGVQGVALLDAWSHHHRLPKLLQRFVGTLWRKGIYFIQLLSSPQSYLREALAKYTHLLPLPCSRNPYYLTVKPLCGSIPESMLDFRQWNLVGGDVL